ncbi:MAG: sensor domain-containing diguanylate cyclase [Acidobacteriota bacterium]
MNALQQRLETINEIARIASLDLELRPMMQRITDALAQKFGWEFVALVMVDADRTAFVCEAVTTEAETEIYAGYSRPLGSGVVGEVAATERPILLDDVRQWPNYVETMRGAMSELCVPVMHSGRLVAILNLESTRAGAFHDQLALLTTVAEQIAGAIANARLFEQTSRRAALMQMMSEVSRTALEATDLGELLQRIVRYVHERFAVELVAIRLNGVATSAQAGVSVEDCADLVVPIRFRGEALGVFRIESRSDEVFTPASVLAFESFADQVAGAIHLASMKELVDRRTRDLEEANAHLARAIETLHRLSTTDPLTGAANRRQFDDAIDLEWRRAARSQSPLTLMMIDIDGFKAFNDAHGHQAGDDCLRRVADVLRERLHRAGDLVARYGGEEFAVLVAGVGRDHARDLAEALRAAVAELGATTISVGVAHCVPRRDQEPEALIRLADDALYAAKDAGRNRVVVSG